MILARVAPFQLKCRIGLTIGLSIEPYFLTNMKTGSGSASASRPIVQTRSWKRRNRPHLRASWSRLIQDRWRAEHSKYT